MAACHTVQYHPDVQLLGQLDRKLRPQNQVDVQGEAASQLLYSLLHQHDAPFTEDASFGTLAQLVWLVLLCSI
jgi:hypothetical protein